jgi:hypothetical protein
MDLDEDDHDAADTGAAAASAPVLAPAESTASAHFSAQTVQAQQRESRDKHSGKRRVQPMMMTSPSRPPQSAGLAAAGGGGGGFPPASSALAAAAAGRAPHTSLALQLGGLPPPSASMNISALQNAAAQANAAGWSDAVALAAAAREAQSLVLPSARLGAMASGAGRAVRIKLQGSAPGRLELRALARKGAGSKGRSVGEVSYVVDCQGENGKAATATGGLLRSGAEAAGVKDGIDGGGSAASEPNVEVRWRLLLGFLPVAAVADERRAVVATSDGAVHVLSSASGVRLLPPLMPGRGVALLRLRADRLLIVTTDGELLVWHLGQRRLERRLPLAPLLPSSGGQRRKKAKAAEAAEVEAHRRPAEHEQLADVDVTHQGEVLAYKTDLTVSLFKSSVAFFNRVTYDGFL